MPQSYRSREARQARTTRDFCLKVTLGCSNLSPSEGEIIINLDVLLREYLLVNSGDKLYMYMYIGHQYWSWRSIIVLQETVFTLGNFLFHFKLSVKMMWC